MSQQVCVLHRKNPSNSFNGQSMKTVQVKLLPENATKILVNKRSSTSSHLCNTSRSSLSRHVSCTGHNYNGPHNHYHQEKIRRKEEETADTLDFLPAD